MSKILDIESRTKKRRIEDVLDENSDLIASPETSIASGSVVVDVMRPVDGNVATTVIQETRNPPEIEVKAQDDHLAKKRRLDSPQAADPNAESASPAMVNLQTEAVEVDVIGEKDLGIERLPNEQGAGKFSKGKSPEDSECSTGGSQPIAEDVHTVQKRCREESELESDVDTVPPILPTSSTDLNSTTVGTQETNSVATGSPAKKQRIDSAKSTSATNNDSVSKLTQADEPLAELEAFPKQPPLLSLPFELLAEVLIQTGSSQHVLAIARTCKALCHLLLSPEAQFIWRAARNGAGCTFDLEPSSLPPIMVVPPGMHGGGVAGVVWGVMQGVAMVPATVITMGPVPNASGPPAPNQKTVKLPNLPAQFFSEAAYAAFVFDSGKCESCGKETSVMYNSFGLRARLCKKTSCKEPRNLMLYNEGVDAPILSTLPTNEMESFANQPISAQTLWPAPMRHFLRKDAFAAAEAEYVARHNDGEYQNKFRLRQTRRKEWMDFCAELYKWKCARQEQYYRTKKANEDLGKQLASKHGWDYDQIIGHTKYGVYKRHKTQLIESVTETDVNAMKDDIEAELLAYSTKAERRKTEISQMQNRKDVSGLYERLRSGSLHTYLPSLSTFRQLPVISMLQTAERDQKSSSVVETLEKNPAMNNLLNDQLKKWADKAKMDFGAILGFPKNWRHASKNILHPVERVTARFVCTRCQRVDAKYREDGCLDFAGACKHECGVGNQKKGRTRTRGPKAIWDSKNFAKDDKAINALKKILPLLNYAEDKDGGNCLTKVGMAVMCTSCDPPMVLDTRSIVGHSHRHDNIQLSLPMLNDVYGYLGGYPYEHGVVNQLLGPTGVSPKAKAEIDAKNFGCRHCLRRAQVNEATNGTHDGASSAQTTGVSIAVESSNPIELASVIRRLHDTGIQGPLTNPPPLFSFNGMRSHLKAKHNIEDIRDEDILCYREVNLKSDDQS